MTTINESFLNILLKFDKLVNNYLLSTLNLLTIVKLFFRFEYINYFF